MAEGSGRDPVDGAGPAAPRATPEPNPAGAVFISYASQDASAAGRIADALRAAGIEVWFDQTELRGGDAWDQSIRRQIKTCALFLPVISRNTHIRDEGYFRLEWKLAVDRCHLMAADKAFVLPVVIDDTRDDDERVPERFREVQWTRLSGGTTPAAFVERVQRLLSGDLSQGPTTGSSQADRVSAAPRRRQHVVLASSWSKAALLLTVAAVVVVLGYFVAGRVVLSKRGAEVGTVSPSAAHSAPATAFNPPPHSIAVLPFVNLSGDKEQEYFSDGLTAELLNALSRINELQVAARTSAFSFKGKDVKIGNIARELNVAAVLEGSVRRSGHTVRITAQLINGATGFSLWSNSYDRDLKDILRLQTEIATAVTTALKATLLADTAALVELGGTQDPQAFDAYLRGERLVGMPLDRESSRTQLAAYAGAIRHDPHFAKAFLGLALAQVIYASNYTSSSGVHAAFEEARASAEKAVALAPELGQAHAVLGFVLDAGFQDYTAAAAEHERALALSPGDSRVLLMSARFLAEIGREQTAVANAQRAIVLDPLNAGAYRVLGLVYLYTHRYRDAVVSYDRALSINPLAVQAAADRGLAQAALGELESAHQSCATPPLDWISHMCLAIVLHALKRPADAQAELATLRASADDESDLAYQYAQIYAQWGESEKALSWLETADRVRDPGLIQLKVDYLMNPLRREPRFQSILAKMKFPD